MVVIPFKQSMFKALISAQKYRAINRGFNTLLNVNICWKRKRERNEMGKFDQPQIAHRYCEDNPCKKVDLTTEKLAYLHKGDTLQPMFSIPDILC